MKKRIRVVPAYKQRQQERLEIIEGSTLNREEILELLQELNSLRTSADDDNEHIAQLSAIVELLNTQVGQLQTNINLSNHYVETLTEFVEGEITSIEALSRLPPEGKWRQLLRAYSSGETRH